MVEGWKSYLHNQYSADAQHVESDQVVTVLESYCQHCLNTIEGDVCVEKHTLKGHFGS